MTALSMRQACAPVMAELGEADPTLTALGADGFSIFPEFAARFPGRFVDVGIAEANLVGVAAGLARSGKRVFVGAIASFLLRRAYEQVRNDVCDPGLRVALVGVGGGFSYGRLGATHHMTEDFALLRAAPNVAVFSPADVHDARWCLRAAAAWDGPAYIRLGAREDPLVHHGGEDFRLGVPTLLRQGRDVLLVATGACVAQALAAADQLAGCGVSAAVCNVTCIRPLDAGALRALAAPFAAVVVAEEHSAVGGLGAAVADALAGAPAPRLARLGIPPCYPPVGTREELLTHFGLDGPAIAQAACRLLDLARQVSP